MSKEKTVEVKYVVPKSLEKIVQQKLKQKISDEATKYAEKFIEEHTFAQIEKFIEEQADKLLGTKEIRAIIKKQLKEELIDIIQDNGVEELLPRKSQDKLWSLVTKGIIKTLNLKP